MRPLKGELRVPGDKSISHRVLILSALTQGLSILEGVSDAEDVRSTWRCLMRMGVNISSKGDRIYVRGTGWRGLEEPKEQLNAGNSGTTIRLLMELIAGNPIAATLTGDDSLRRRPMERVAAPLRLMGATIDLEDGGRAPARVTGAALGAIHYKTPVASAQIKSSILLAGLLAVGTTTVTEPVLSRDHTERLLPLYGIKPVREGLSVSVLGGQPLAKVIYRVPGDASSAAFWTVAALLVPGSALTIKKSGLNPTRTGFLEVLKRMGAKVDWHAPAGDAEPVGDIHAAYSPLKACTVEPAEVPGLIDEIPILALAASQAEGESRFKALGELRHKESDRLAGMVALLKALGGQARAEGDDLIVTGPRKLKGAKVASLSDHRLAMTGCIAGLFSDGEVKVDDSACIDISYPGFMAQWRRLRG